MRRIGNGYTGMKRFLVLMNHPAPMTEKNYRKVNKIYRYSAKEVADKIMKEAALELRSNNNSNDELGIVDTGVSVDGTWQKRGFTSLNGAVAAISTDTGRILNVEVMTRYCQGCINIMKYKDDLELYEHLQKEHTCKINHEGYAGKMELVGVQRIFSRSTETRKLRYLAYYGDGDSKSFTTVENVYSPKVVTQKSIGHVRKRVGTHLRNSKNSQMAHIYTKQEKDCRKKQYNRLNQYLQTLLMTAFSVSVFMGRHKIKMRVLMA